MSLIMSTLPASPTQVHESREKMKVKQLPTNKVPSHPALGLADCEGGKSKGARTHIYIYLIIYFYIDIVGVVGTWLVVIITNCTVRCKSIFGTYA